MYLASRCGNTPLSTELNIGLSAPGRFRQEEDPCRARGFPVAKTKPEQIPRIFHVFKAHVPAPFRVELPIK
jgi:hypothetical protein